jgi:hypothetical protein
VHLTEMLAEHEGIALSRPSVHRILATAGVAPVRKRRAPRHRRRRDRMPRAGMLLQIAASRHDWLEGRGPWLSLVGGIADATGQVPWARFRVPGSTYQPQADVLRRQSCKLRRSKRTGRNGLAYASTADCVLDGPDG